MPSSYQNQYGRCVEFDAVGCLAVGHAAPGCTVSWQRMAERGGERRRTVGEFRQKRKPRAANRAGLLLFRLYTGCQRSFSSSW